MSRALHHYGTEARAAKELADLRAQNAQLKRIVGALMRRRHSARPREKVGRHAD